MITILATTQNWKEKSCDILLNYNIWIINLHIMWNVCHSYYNTSISCGWNQSKLNAYYEIFEKNTFISYVMSTSTHFQY
jgi:hypothetical protein